jgi:hypothetical protein
VQPEVRSKAVAIGAHDLTLRDLCLDFRHRRSAATQLRENRHFRSPHVVEIHEEWWESASTVRARATLLLIDVPLHALARSPRHAQHALYVKLAILAIPDALVLSVVLAPGDWIFPWHVAIIHTRRHASVTRTRKASRDTAETTSSGGEDRTRDLRFMNPLLYH